MLTIFFFNDTATTEIYPLSLHDPLPISEDRQVCSRMENTRPVAARVTGDPAIRELEDILAENAAAARSDRKDRKSTRLNSSHANISYAVFCLKKKKKTSTPPLHPAPFLP